MFLFTTRCVVWWYKLLLLLVCFLHKTPLKGIFHSKMKYVIFYSPSYQTCWDIFWEKCHSVPRNGLFSLYLSLSPRFFMFSFDIFCFPVQLFSAFSFLSFFIPLVLLIKVTGLVEMLHLLLQSFMLHYVFKTKDRLCSPLFSLCSL